MNRTAWGKMKYLCVRRILMGEPKYGGWNYSETRAMVEAILELADGINYSSVPKRYKWLHRALKLLTWYAILVTPEKIYKQALAITELKRKQYEERNAKS